MGVANVKWQCTFVKYVSCMIMLNSIRGGFIVSSVVSVLLVGIQILNIVPPVNAAYSNKPKVSILA